MRMLRGVLLLAVVAIATTAAAQTTTGTISGHVTDSQGLMLPGVTVNVSSPNLQGVRTAVTSANGDYIVAQLPPGVYTITYELSGFETRTEHVTVAPTQVRPLDVSLGVERLTEAVTVVGKTADVLTQTAQAAVNFTQALIAKLPTNRTIDSTLLLAPAVHASGPAGNYSIAGAMSYDTLYMVNGVNVNENLRGQANVLFIEDAIQETTIATSGISAEFGRFGGGVVNVVTKSGGNRFSGSFRDTLYNDNWRSLTPFPGDFKVDKTVPTYEYTLGGPLLRDRLWFFTAGRLQTQNDSRQLAITRQPYEYTRATKRFEGKGTYSVNPNHTVQGNYTKILDKETNGTYSTGTSMDTNSLYNRENPQNLWSVNYNGILFPSFFLEARLSARHLTFIGSGSPYTDVIKGTLLLDRQRNNTRYWSATFCGICTAEQRNNEEGFVKGTYFLSTRGHGSHNMVFGYDNFNDKRLANNHQSGSDWRIYGTTTIIQNGQVYPQWLGDGSTYFYYQPIMQDSLGTNFRTHSLFYNDNWRLNERFTVNLGARWDKNHGVDSMGTLVARDSAFSPRVGVVWDPVGDQQWSITGSVAKYVTALNNGIADSGSAAGVNATYEWTYFGPAINPPGTASPVTSDVAIQQLFDWFNANGGRNRTPNQVDLPGFSKRILGSLDSPSVLEYAAGVSRQIGSRGAARLDASYRTYQDFYGTKIDTATGRVTNAVGQSADFAEIVNTDVVHRRYAGMTASASYRFTPLFDVGGNYTLSHAWGNFDGENQNSGPLTTQALSYPEYLRMSWYSPEGDLGIDQRHHARAWANYGLPFAPGMTLSVLQDLGSGAPLNSATGVVDARPYVTNPGYVTPQGGSTNTYYFYPRDAFRTEAYRRTDAAINYSHKLQAMARNLELFGQIQVLNVFNDFQLCGCGDTVFRNGGAINANTINQSILSASNSPAYQKFDPFTTQPVEGVNFAKGPLFGKALNRNAYTSPRTLRMSFGIRF